ncbi:MAG: hypothetical protein KBO59_17590, partial [Achromobacter sp.]|nr:hypothetical protein [Achromobacter sp.]
PPPEAAPAGGPTPLAAQANCPERAIKDEQSKTSNQRRAIKDEQSKTSNQTQTINDGQSKPGKS